MSTRPFVDWLPESSANSADTLDADPDRRIGWLMALLTLPLLIVAVRLAHLQGRLQPEFLAVYSETRAVEEDLPARNGRILAADGLVLADDVMTYDVCVHYRWLEQPADPHWLRRQAWSRLSRSERRQSALVASELANVQARRDQLWHDLGELTNRSGEELQRLRREIQYRVESIWWSVNERREHVGRMSNPSGTGRTDWTSVLLSWVQLSEALTQPPARMPLPPLVIQEQEDFHALLTNVDADVAAEIEAHPERYPGVRIESHSRRSYPQRDLAAHLLGARTAIGAEASADSRADAQGRSGLERQYDAILQGRRGRQRTVLDRHGDVLRTEVIEPPQHGRDVVLTLDPQLQRRTEQLLDAALDRIPSENAAEDEAPGTARQPPQGGCLVALDVHTGAVIVAASAPRFDANWLVTPNPEHWQAAAADPRKPFFPRITQMALPPGSVFKAATAVALLETGTFDPHTPIHCQGYLDRPDQYRCLAFRHYGFGHGSVTLGDALCRSCNVYFFTGARRAGAEALADWASKLGIGQPTGIDLPGEASGRLPSPGRAGSVSSRVSSERWHPGDTLGLAIGQSSLTVTPLQMARMMAAIANEGFLVTPHLVASGGPVVQSALEARPAFAHPEPTPIVGLHHETLAAIRAGLYRTVHDPQGTAYHSVRLPEVAIAGKTGTAEVGGGRPDHAWFAGYVPADRPRIAFTVVLEHGGSGGKVAGPVAREFVKSLLDVGLLSTENDLAHAHDGN